MQGYLSHVKAPNKTQQKHNQHKRLAKISKQCLNKPKLATKIINKNFDMHHIGYGVGGEKGGKYMILPYSKSRKC